MSEGMIVDRRNEWHVDVTDPDNPQADRMVGGGEPAGVWSESIYNSVTKEIQHATVVRGLDGAMSEAESIEWAQRMVKAQNGGREDD